MERYQNKYRIPSSRASFWNYGWVGAYLTTICTRDRQCLLGRIESSEMVLSTIGEIANEEWQRTFTMRPDMNLQMGAYIVMPNHIHGIVIIGQNAYNQRKFSDPVETQCIASPTASPIASPTASPIASPTTMNHFAPQSKNLASIIRGFKISVTKRARSIHADFAWQARFHDRIIRDDKAYQTISNYIINNPSNWEKDKFHSGQ